MNAPAPARYMQGIAVPASAVNPQEFFVRTDRQESLEYKRTYAGLGGQDVVVMKKAGIVSMLLIRFVGTVTITPNTGSVDSTFRWPLDLARSVKFTANGQSNLINISGAGLKAFSIIKRGDLTDRGVARTVAGASVSHGTLSQASERWGVGSQETGIAAGDYDVDVTWEVPVAEDQQDLHGAIFAATSSTDLSLTIDWATLAELFTLNGDATAGVSGEVQVHAVRYEIPQGSDGEIIIPDLSMFHSLLQNRETNLGNGENEIRMTGQGAGKTLLRQYSRLINNGAPVTPNSTNFGKLGWRYAANETPAEYADGMVLRRINEMAYNCDLGAVHGYFCHEFASENALRDAVDLGTTSEWRQIVTVNDAVALASPALESISETVYAAGAGA